jgi:hypothetical protein
MSPFTLTVCFVFQFNVLLLLCIPQFQLVCCFFQSRPDALQICDTALIELFQRFCPLSSPIGLQELIELLNATSSAKKLGETLNFGSMNSKKLSDKENVSTLNDRSKFASICQTYVRGAAKVEIN